MPRSAKTYIAQFDSAAAMLRALSNFLHGRDFPALGASPLLKPLAVAANRLPENLREQVYAWGGWTEAIPADRADQVRGEAIAEWAVGHYPRRRYPGAMIGSSSGALVHLCAALGMPWLPQTVLVPIRLAGMDPDDPRRALEHGKAPGKALLDASPELQLHHMHDPNQDRLMLGVMSYFRVKRRRLGAAFERFLDETLDPGSTLYLVECRWTWPVTRVDDRHVFQFGAPGGARVEEYFQGGPRVAAYLARYGIDRDRWDPPAPDAQAPEAEWGFEPALAEDVERFARERGHRVCRIIFEEPEHLSPLVAELYRWWYGRRGLDARRLLVESFILMDPYWTLRTGSVPFWMKFNKEPSADWLERYLDEAGPYDDIHLMLFAHGVDSVGLPPLERWRAILRRARRRGGFIGVDEDAHPRDFATFARYHSDLQKLAARYPLPGYLTEADLGAFLRSAGRTFPVEWRPAPD